MHELQTPTLRGPAAGSRRRAGAALLLVATAALGLGACSPGSSSVPSVAVPTIGTSGSPVAACVDAATMAIIDQLKAPGADIPALLESNKDLLIAGLGTLQPADAATGTWRDELVAALQSGDMTTAADKAGELVSGGVTLTAC